MTASNCSEPYSPTSESSQGYSIDEKSIQPFSTLEVVPASNLEHYVRASEVRRSFYQNWFSSGQDENNTRTPPSNDAESTVPISAPTNNGSTANDGPPAPPTRITICGMPQKAFWIVFGVITGLIALGAIIGGAVGGTRNAAVAAVVPTVTAIVTVTTNPTSSTSSTSSGTIAAGNNTTAAPATTSSVCVGGIGVGNYVGLCSFACGYGYCPAGPCTCTSSGAPLPTPATTGQDGIPLSGEDESYLGLCSFCCNHGYCPSSACTISAY